MKAKQIKINLPKLNLQKIILKIKGSTPLIVNRFSNDSQSAILDKQTGVATNGKAPKDVNRLYLNSIYFFPDKKRTGFPSAGIKASMVRAGKQLGLNMTDTRGLFHVLAHPEGGDLIEVIGEHNIRFDKVRLNGTSSDVRVRAEYKKWRAEITFLYNANTISRDQLANILRMAGFACGLGEWRPEKSNSGQFGLFDLN